MARRFVNAARKLPAVMLAWAVTLSLPAAAETQPGWTRQFEEAVERIRKGDVACADRLFAELWKSNANDFALANAIGSALESAGRHSEAAPWYQKAIRLNPRFLAASNNLALNYAARGDLRAAARLLRDVTRMDPRHAPAFYNLGLVEMQLGAYDEAARAFGRAHELGPRERDPLVRLAYVYFRSGRRKEGMEAIRELTESPPGPQSRLLAAQVLNSFRMSAEALEQVSEARKISANTPALTFEEGAALFHLGRYAQASKVLYDSGPRTAVDADYYLLLGSAQALSSDLGGAVRALQEAARTAPNRPEPYFRLALVFMEGYRDRDALEVLSTGLRGIPDSPLLWFGMGIVHEVSGRSEDAINDLRKSLEAKGDQANVWGILGEIYSKLDRYEPAEESYRMAVRQGAPDETTVKYAELLIRLRRFDEAERYLRRVLKREPRSPKALVALGRLYNAKKQYALAEKPLRAAVGLDPDNGDAHLFLALALGHLGRRDEAHREGELAGRKKAESRERQNLLREVLVPAEDSATTRQN